MISVNNQPCCHKAKKYITPKTTVFSLEMNSSILVASNEGLEYENLFSSPESIVKDESFPVLF